MAVAFFAAFFNQIPLASLAAILIVVGYKLSRPAMYKDQFKKGQQQFVPFITTIVAILLTDLLVGILVGMMVGFYYILHTHNAVSRFHVKTLEADCGMRETRIHLSQQVSFLKKADLLAALDTIDEGTRVIINGDSAKAIDRDVIELLRDFQDAASDKNIEVVYESLNI